MTTHTPDRLDPASCRILLVEDDDADAGLVTWALNRQTEFAYSMDRGRTVEECLAACEEQVYDVILLDLNLPGSAHLETLKTVTAAFPGPAVIVISGMDDQSTALEAVQVGAQDYLVKQNVNQHEICRAIHYARERKQTRDYMVRLREELLAHVSHELRTPLSAAIGAVEMLEDDGSSQLSPAAARLLAMVSSNLLLLRTMVGDLIDTTMVRSGKLGMVMRLTPVPALVQPVVHAMTSLAESASLTLSCDVDDERTVLIDPERITQVLINLISNAIKYTPAGGEVRVFARAGGTDRVRLGVRDTGAGIPPESLPYLFDRHYQVPKDPIATSRRGLGLGLFISSEIVKAHGGRIEVQSQLGSGSTFTFEIPTP